MKFSNPHRSALADQYNTLYGSGTLVALATAYPGLDRQAALVTGDIIAEYTLPATPFTESDGVLTLQGVPLEDVSANNAGEIAAVALLASGDDGSTAAGSQGGSPDHPRAFFSAGESGDTVDLSSFGGAADAAVEVVFDNKTISAGQTTRITGLTVTLPVGDAAS